MMMGSVQYGLSETQSMEVMRTCAACGKRFYACRAHAYKTVKKNKATFFCSWDCFSPVDKAEREKHRKKVMGKWVDASSSAPTNRRQISNRIYKTRTRIRYWMGKREEPGFDRLTKDRQAEIEMQIEYYKAKEAELRRMLEENR